MKPDQDTQSPPRSQLFSVRVWREELAENQHEWRGKVQHVASGEASYFRDWDGLLMYLKEMLSLDDLVERPDDLGTVNK